MHSPKRASVFGFHSSLPVCLHYALCQEAGISARRGPPTATPAPTTTSASASPWEAALQYYRRELARYELQDTPLKTIKDQLVALDDDGEVRDAGLPEPLGELLAAAAPLYRTQQWLAHDEANQRWIAEQAPHVERLGPRILPRMVAAFQTRAPEEGLRVDLTPYAGWAGAYTTYNPPFPNHITIASALEANQGWLGVETIFHEAAHTIVSPVEGRLAEGIARAREGKVQQGPRDLWHIVLFYTVGEIVREALREEGITDFVPYAYAQGLYDRAPQWKPAQHALEQHWQRYLDGAIGYDEALIAVVAALQS